MADETINMEVKSNIGDVVKETDKLSKSTKKATISFGGMFNAISKLNIVTKIFDVFKQLLGENQVVVDAMATAMNFLSIAFSDFFKFIQSNIGTVTGYFKNIFEDPIGAMEDFARTMIDRVVESFNSLIESIGLATRALIKLFKGDFKGAFDDMKEAGKELVDVVTGVDGSVDKITKVVKKGVSALSEYAQTTFKAAEAQTELDKAVNKSASSLEALNIEFDKQAEKQQRIIDNERTSFEDKKAALEELTRLTKENNEANVAAQELLVEQARIDAKRTGNDVDAIKLQEEKNKLAGIQVANLNNLNTANDNYSNAVIAADEAVKKSKQEMASAVGSAIGALGGLLQEGSAAAKAAALTQIAIDTGVGFVQGLNIAQKSAAAAGPGAALAFPIFYATQVAAVLAAAGQAKQILGAGGGGVTPPSTTTPTTPAPQMMSGAFELSGGTEPEAFRAYVVTDEMTNSQNQLANIRRRATI